MEDNTIFLIQKHAKLEGTADNWNLEIENIKNTIRLTFGELIQFRALLIRVLENTAQIERIFSYALPKIPRFYCLKFSV